MLARGAVSLHVWYMDTPKTETFKRDEYYRLTYGEDGRIPALVRADEPRKMVVETPEQVEARAREKAERTREFSSIITDAEAADTRRGKKKDESRRRWLLRTAATLSEKARAQEITARSFEEGRKRVQILAAHLTDNTKRADARRALRLGPARDAKGRER